MRWACVSIPFHLRPLAPPFGFLETLFHADERAELAVLEVLRCLNRPFFFVFRSDTRSGPENVKLLRSCDCLVTCNLYMHIIHSAVPTAVRSRIWHARTHHVQRRHLFKLPDLNSLPYPFADPAGVKPQTYHEHKVLPYTRRQLYAVVSDVGSYASFVPFCTRSRVLRTLAPIDPNNTTHTSQSGALRMEAELTVAFLGFTECYTSRVTCVPYESVQAVAASSTPLFKTLETTWRFLPAAAGAVTSPGVDDTGPTILSLDLTYEFANPVHAAVSGAFFGKVSTLMVKAFEERCVRVYGPR